MIRRLCDRCLNEIPFNVSPLIVQWKIPLSLYDTWTSLHGTDARAEPQLVSNTWDATYEFCLECAQEVLLTSTNQVK